MAGWQPFGYEGKPGTCLWCGRKLRYRRVLAGNSDKGNPTYREDGYHFATIQAAQAGAYQDGHFDTMSCGYLFGNRMANLDRRLRSRTGD